MTVFDLSVKGRTACPITIEGEKYHLDAAPRECEPQLPELDELTLVRHYTALSKKTYGVDDGFYPLGSCTMKYNPKVNEKVAQNRGFLELHPTQNAPGAIAVMASLAKKLKALTGMDEFTLQPAAGAHGEYTSLQIIRAYHLSRGDTERKKIIVPDSAHGTNPASAAMAGFEIVNVKSTQEGFIDLAALKEAANCTTAALMLTNPNTLGVFDKNIKDIAEIIHGAGGLLYYDGANLNPIMGVIRPGDMGFDLIHLNLHKTFSTPHGGGGAGSGPVGCKAFLADFLPSPQIKDDGSVNVPKKTVGRVKSGYGNFGVMVRALAYLETLGAEGVADAAKKSVLNANYLKAKLADVFPAATDGYCMHEFAVSLADFKEKTGVSALDYAKALIDGGIHPPTMYFPLIVHEALMFEPTETESKETLDRVSALIHTLCADAGSNAEKFHSAPLSTPIGRPDEVGAARNPRLVAALKL